MAFKLDQLSQLDSDKIEGNLINLLEETKEGFLRFLGFFSTEFVVTLFDQFISVLRCVKF